MATFEDVSPTHPQFRYVEKLAGLGITRGCSAAPRRFCPDEPVTRDQLAAFVQRAFPFVAPTEACAP
jgi:hypothetical protein